MRTPAQSTAWARGQSKSPSKNWYMLCLNFVMNALGAPSTGTPSAIKGWHKTPSSQRRTSGTPPKGHPIYWSTGTYGHVALSDGNGYCWSNDISRRGKIDRVKISTIGRKWGARYLGWTTTYIGHSIPSAAPSPYWSCPDGTSRNGAVWPVVYDLSMRLNEVGFKHPITPRWNQALADAYAAYQRSLGYSGRDADGRPGPTSWNKLKVRKTGKQWVEPKPTPPPSVRIVVPKNIAREYGYSQSSYLEQQLVADKSWRTRHFIRNLNELEARFDEILRKLEG